MKIELIGKEKTIISNAYSKHGYFAWPTVARLQDGKIMVGASGFRIEHVCPFGKAVVSYSYDNGNTYTLPAPVIDTPLDDRDAGICPFGEKGVIVTSFNNSADMQRQYNTDNEYVQSYINTITKEDEEKYLGSVFRVSNDCGITFGEIMHSPVTSPHGPIQLRDGTIMWAGNDFSDYSNGISVVTVDVYSGKTEFVEKLRSTVIRIFFPNRICLNCPTEHFCVRCVQILSMIQFFQLCRVFQRTRGKHGPNLKCFLMKQAVHPRTLFS